MKITINRPTIGNVLNGIDMPISCDIQGFLRNWGTLTTFFFICMFHYGYIPDMRKTIIVTQVMLL